MAIIFPEDFFRELFEEGLVDPEEVPYIDDDGNVIFLNDNDDNEDNDDDDSGW